MTIEALLGKVRAEPLKLVAQHWAMVRGDRPVPGWRNIRPSAIAAQLPILWAWKYDPARDSFTGRLAGDAIEAIFGRSFRGADMREIFPAGDYERIFARHKRVVTEPALFHGHGLVFRHLDRYGLGERIILPLSESGGACDGLVGATVYEVTEGSLSPGASQLQEIEEWFPVG